MKLKIFERKHPLTAAFDATFLLFILLMSPAMLVGIWFSERKTEWPAWVDISLYLVLFLAGIFIFIMCAYEFWVRYNRYVNLCIAGKPAVVITDSELHIYSPSGGYNIYNWDEIHHFKIVHGKQSNDCIPIFRDDEMNPSSLAMIYKIYTIAIRTDKLEISEEELLTELNKHLKTK